MNSFTSSFNWHYTSKIFTRTIYRPILICLFLLTLYQTLVSGGVLPASDGISVWQTNVIKAERYAYHNQPDVKMVLVGSSLTNRLQPEFFEAKVINLAMSGRASQTGLEIVKRTKDKPSIVLVEVNDTIDRKIDAKLIDYVYQPVLHIVRYYVSMFRQEYQPVSIFMSYLKNSKNQNGQEDNESANPKLREKLIAQRVNSLMQPLSDSEKRIIGEEVEDIKAQIATLKKDGVRVVLFDVPIEKRVANATKQKEVRKLLRSLFPADSYEWLPEPSSKNWVTTDGLHLGRSEAKEYALFLKEKLL